MINRQESDIIKDWKGTLKTPTVSICCITYNHESFIASALNGFLIQKTIFPFEIIIRDDCSTDNTAKIIKDYVAKYPQLIKPIFEKENQYSNGIKSTPVCIAKARGKYIALCEGDDYWQAPYKLQKQVDFLENNDEYVATYHNSTIVDEKNKLIANVQFKNARDYTADEMLCSEAIILTNTVMFRNKNIKHPPAFDSVVNGDMCLWHLLGKYGACKYLGNIKPAAYRIHSGGIWSSLNRADVINESIKTKFAIINNLSGDILHQKRVYDAILSLIIYNLMISIISLRFVLCGRILLLIISYKINIFKLFELFLSKINNKIKKLLKLKEINL
ncbi:MAG: glycosyltransferase [Candidatus Peribacteraceae bacterium]|nr:glycosyltransferase [Candidatus Peribacteraceae bacterium]